MQAGCHPPFSFESHHSLTYRNPAHAESLCDLILGKSRALLELTIEDEAAYIGCTLLTTRLTDDQALWRR